MERERERDWLSLAFILSLLLLYLSLYLSLCLFLFFYLCHFLSVSNTFISFPRKNWKKKRFVSSLMLSLSPSPYLFHTLSLSFFPYFSFYISLISFLASITILIHPIAGAYQPTCEDTELIDQREHCRWEQLTYTPEVTAQANYCGLYFKKKKNLWLWL